MWPDHPIKGAVSGRVTTTNLSAGLPHAYVAIVNACNTSQAFYTGESDPNGFYTFPQVNNTYNGSGYNESYRIYANHSLFGYGFSPNFSVESSATAPTGVSIIPMAAHIQISADCDFIIANGSDTIKLSAYATDYLGDPVADGIRIDFWINPDKSYDADTMGRWDSGPTQVIHSYATNGYANVSYGWIPADSTGETVRLSAFTQCSEGVETLDSVYITVKPTSLKLPMPVLVNAPPMWGYDQLPPVHQNPGAVSGRVTTMNTSFGLPGVYIAIVNASNTSEAFYETTSDANGFYQFYPVNHTFDGYQYQPRYKIYANHSVYGSGYSNSFPVWDSSTSPANIALVGQSIPDPTPMPETVHIKNRDFPIVPAPAMNASEHVGAVSGRLTTWNLSCGIADADILIVNASNVTQAYYVGKSDPQGYYQFTSVNSTPMGSSYDYWSGPYKIYAYSDLFGEGYSNSFRVESSSTAIANVVIIPGPFNIQVSMSKNTLIANGSDHLTLLAYVTDVNGDPVANGTLLNFIINTGSTYDPVVTGHWNQTTDQQVVTVTGNGYVNLTYGWIHDNSTTERQVTLTVADHGNLSLNSSVNITVIADPAQIDWTRIVSGPRKTGESIVPLQDGYAIAGTISPQDVGEDLYLARTDLNGSIVWEKSYDLNRYDQGRSVIAVRDGFVIAGTTVESSGLTDVCIVRTDASGNVIWQKTYGGDSSDAAMSIISVNDGYVVTGLTFSSGHGSADVYLLKIDPKGNVIWEQTYGGADWECGYSVAATSDGYILLGYTSSVGNGDVYLIKTDNMGNLVWDKTYGGNDVDDGRSIIVASDGYVIAGYTVSFADHSYASGSCDLYLLKTDMAGNIVWQKVYGGIRGDLGNSIAAANDGYVIAGSSDADTGFPDVYLVKTDLNGDLIWEETCGEAFLDEGKSVAVVKDGYVIAGQTLPSHDGNSQLYLVKINEISAPDTSKIVTYNQSLYEGWNLISIPLELQNYNLSSIFSAELMNNIISIWGWNESTQSWEFYCYDPNHIYYQYLPALTRLQSGKAYWVQMGQPGSMTITGTVPDYAPGSQTVPGSGWNFVGTTGMSSPLIASMYPDAVSVWGWNEVTQSWEIYCYDPNHIYYQYLPELDIAHPGSGYWVQME